MNCNLKRWGIDGAKIESSLQGCNFEEKESIQIVFLSETIAALEKKLVSVL